MTPNEFKEKYPEYKYLEGDELFNAMEEHMLRWQDSEQTLKATRPFWKRYTLRWLFYRNKPNMAIRFNYPTSERCKKCKRSLGPSRMVFMDMTGSGKNYWPCPECGEELEVEENTNFDRKLFLAKHNLVELFWEVLDRLHICRDTTESRYSMFGDEAHYVKCWHHNMKTGETHPEFKKRKWWEYIFIVKPNRVNL